MPASQSPRLIERKPLLLVIDGHALVHRAWHAIQTPLNVSSTGEEVRAVYGFLNTFLRTLADWDPTHCGVAFDLPVPTFRHKQFKEYKAQRPPTPPELRSQFKHVRELMSAFGVPIFETEGYEADDVIGTLCRQAEERELDTLILTGDTDTLQLVSPWVRVLLTYSIQKKSVYDEAAVRQRYGGLSPPIVADIKALEGDTSDNIPGVPGVGTKTAIRLLTDFGTIEGMLENLDSIPTAKTRQRLEEHRSQVLLAKRLTTISRDVPVELDVESARFWTYNRSAVVDLLRELEFHSIVPRVPDPGDWDGTNGATETLAAAERLPTEYVTVDTPEALSAMLRELSAHGGFSFAVQTTTHNFMDTHLVGLAFSNRPGRGWYVPIGHDRGEQIPREAVVEALQPLLESETTPKTAHNANFGVAVLANEGVQVRNLDFDTMLAAHLCGRKVTGLRELALDTVHEEMPSVTELLGTGRKQITLAQAPIEEAKPYAAAEADFTGRVREKLLREVEEKRVADAFKDVEMPLTGLLVRMQLNGVALSTELLQRMAQELGGELVGIEAGMYELVGHKFNLNSSQQLADVLFKELRLPPTKRTKTGHSTDASSLEGLKHLLDKGQADDVDPKAYEVLDRILEYRQLAKIKSTYVDALPLLVNPRTGRVHTSYNQTGSATGRVSSNDPNVQNIPVRTELGRQVRRAFVAQDAPEWLLLAADYSQIELRILAHLSKDPGLIEAFQSGEDIHAATASSVYGVPLAEVIPDMRRVAKIMNFGVVYGLSPFGISQQTGLSAEEGRTFIDTYFSKYPGIRDYIESVKADVKRDGYAETLLGRRRYIPEINSRNFHVRGSGERMAINMPIQGTAADIVKLAMIRVQERMDALALRSMMIVQVHDELIFETPKDELGQMKQVVMELMPTSMELAVPLDVELKTGNNWGDMG